MSLTSSSHFAFIHTSTAEQSAIGHRLKYANTSVTCQPVRKRGSNASNFTALATQTTLRNLCYDCHLLIDDPTSLATTP